MRRLVLAAEASAAGRGGQAAVARATGASRETIRRGIRELGQPAVGAAKGRIRHPGGGRKRTVEHDPSLREDLDRLVEPTSRGDPESPLRWTCKSVRQLAAALKRQGHQVSHRMVAELLHDMGYSLQANRKTLAGTEHPDRNAQFEHLDRAVQLQLSLGEPVISVDTKKKELVGPFKNGGRELRPKGAPEQVLVHDFLIPDLGRVSPYGVYDIAQNEAWVSVGTDHDTAAFAVESIRRWWRGMGQALYPSATRLLITADAGGSNGYRLRLWKLELQKLAERRAYVLGDVQGARVVGTAWFTTPRPWARSSFKQDIFMLVMCVSPRNYLVDAGCQAGCQVGCTVSGETRRGAGFPQDNRRPGYEKQVGLDLVSSTQLGPAFILGGLGLCRIYQQF